MLKANLGFPFSKVDNVSLYLTLVHTTIVFSQKKIVSQLLLRLFLNKTKNSINTTATCSRLNNSQR